ncbi:transposase [Burkholderia ambifaria]
MAGAPMTRTLASHISERQFGILLNGRNFEKIPVNGMECRIEWESFRWMKGGRPTKCARQSRAHPDARAISAGRQWRLPYSVH